MPATYRDYALRIVRAVLVGGGALVSAGAVYALATVPQPPPGSDGFATGMAYIVGSVVLVLALGATGLGVALPSMLGADDAAGFGPSQRLVLKGAGACFLGGLLVGVVVAAVVGFQFGLLAWFLAILLGVGGVGVALAWRLVEVVVGRVRRAGEGTA
ncbi:MAG: hypothetical protein ABEJ78_06105 [Haloferacaceae archaeon]